MNTANYLSKKYLYWIDYSKGILILIIVFYHFFQNYRDGSGLVNFLYQIGNSLAFTAVNIFFVIAGFNTTLSLLKQVNQNSQGFNQINWFNWLKKRLVRLYPTYWLVILVTMILYLATGHQIKINSLGDFILIAIGWPGYARYKTLNPGFWFFSAILQGYLITPLIFFICNNRPIRILNLGLGLGILTKIICLISLSNNFIDTASLIQNNWILSYIFPFCLGFYWGFIYYKNDQLRRKDWLISLVAFAIGLVIYAILLISKIDVRYMLGFDLLFTPLIMLLCYWVSQKLLKNYLSEGINCATWQKFLSNLFAASAAFVYLITKPDKIY